MTEFWIAISVPIAGWVLFVERRLAQIRTIDEKLDLILEYLVPKEKAKPIRLPRREIDFEG